MGNKKTSLLIIFFLAVPAIHAQNNDSFIETTTRFIQRLTWTASEYVRRYEVSVQTETSEGVYNAAWQGFTTDTFVVISLSPGNYRFRVTTYDFLNLPGQPSAWVAFSIIPALHPEIESFTPHTFSISQNTNEYELNITGKNISQDAEIYLRRPGTTQTIHPQRITVAPDGNTAAISFTKEHLEQGIFLVYIKNLSGLETSRGDLVIEIPSAQRATQTEAQNVPQETQQDTASTDTDSVAVDDVSLNVLLGLNWAPFLNIPQFDQFHLNGAALRFGLISSNSYIFNIGFELSAAYYLFGALLIENNFLLRTRLINQKLYLLFRLGAGLILPVTKESNPLDARVIYANTGFSCYWLISGSFYMEAGLNYSYIFAVENHFSLLRAMLGIGISR